MRVAVVAMLAALLAGCEALPVPRGEPTVARPPAQAPPPEPSEPSETEAEVAPAPKAPPEPQPLPPRPEPRPAFTDIDPETLRGLTPGEAELLLGPPDLRSEEPPAVVWTYIVGPCRLELFFYYDLESQQQRSLTFDLAPGHKGEGAEEFCFALLGRRGAEARRLETVEEQMPGNDAEGAATQTDTATGQKEDAGGE